MSKQYITSSAYLDELESWEQSLRLLLKQIVLLEKSSDLSKATQTDIQILVTQIQSQLLKYRREKTRIMSATENISDFSNIIGSFESRNEKFNQLAERGNEIIQELGSIIQENNHHQKQYATSKAESVVGVVTQRTKSKLQSANKEKGKTRERFEIQRKHAKSFQQTRQKKPAKTVSLFECAGSDLKLQFVTLKNKLLQLHKLVDTHEHPLMEQEISKLKLSNNKILMDIKMLKEQHAYMQNQIFDMKKEINDEKRQEAKREKRGKVIEDKPELRSTGSGVPQWVRVRVKNRE